MPKWTTQQLEAIQREGNLLVAAAAGAGKTAVLTERIAERVRRGTSIKSILVVTFTKAAAGEMKKRIAAALQNAAHASPGDAERLREAAEQAQDASISTLHAFCMQVLHRHFYEAGLDPAFRVADEAQSAILLEDALDELMEARVEQEDFRALCDALGGEENAADALCALQKFLGAQPDPAAWLDAAAARYAMDEAALAGDEAVFYLIAHEKKDLQGMIASYQRARDAVAAAFPAAAAFADEELLRLRALLLREACADYAAALSAMTFATLKGFPRGTADADKDPFKDARNAVKKTVQTQAKRFSRPLAEEAARRRELLPIVRTLCEAFSELDARYAEKKRARGLIDYGDMEHMTLRLLFDPDIQSEYRRKYQYVLVDEYQDINRVQEAILNAVSRGDNLFLVGDVKQSIYRFRQADPTLFTEKYNDPACFGGEVIDLNKNFRSTDAVIGAVNDLFSRTMTAEFGGVPYDARAALVKGRADAEKGTAELHLIQCAGEDEWENAEAEALFAARRIRAIMENELYLDPATGRARPYAYGDFAILHRSPKAVAERMTQLLAIEGVPSYAELTGGYFDAAEVQVFMNLLRIVDNRRQDIPLLSVLRSFIGGFADAELARLRLIDQDAPWCELLTLAAAREDDLGKKAGAFLDKLDAWNTESRLVRVSALCAQLLDDTGYGAYCAALPGGRTRRANLDALLSRAQAYEQEEARSLADFIRFMDRVRNNDGMGASTVLGADVVRVLSTHKSKGLEFPVVLLTGLSRRFNKQDQTRWMVMNERLGLGLRYRRDSVRYDTLLRESVLAMNDAAAMEEELRILYVAMTRAKEKLIMILSERDIAAAVQKRDVALSPMACAHALHESDWILSAALQSADGDPLRDFAGLPLRGGAPKLNAFAHVGVGACTEPEKAAYAAFAEKAKTADASRYAGMLSWRYPYLADTGIPGKLSVSELIGNLPAMRAYPDFIAEKRALDAADRGTAAHLLMELIPLRLHTAESVRDCVESLVENGRMQRRQADAIAVGPVVGFFASALGRRLCASGHVERERDFNYRVSARKAIAADTDEPMLLQGVIDCCFEEDGAWVLLDYKTDFVPEGRARETAMRHKRQLEIYADALTALTGMPVKEKYIHLLRTGESVPL